MKRPKTRGKLKVRGYDTGGSAAPTTGSASATSGTQSYTTNLMNLRGALGGASSAPYSQTQGGNAMFRKGGPVGGKVKSVRKR